MSLQVRCYVGDNKQPFYQFDYEGQDVDADAFNNALVRTVEPEKLRPGRWVRYDYDYWLIVQDLGSKALIASDGALVGEGRIVAYVVDWDKLSPTRSPTGTEDGTEHENRVYATFFGSERPGPKMIDTDLAETGSAEIGDI
jgi:hypothetical protein